MSEVHFEMLLGVEVLDPSGRAAGRLEEVVAEARGGELVVSEYHIGSYAMVERLSAWTIGRAVLQLFGASRGPGYRVPWNKMDLSDPGRPRLTCPLAELEAIGS
jgi:sporulation protein YlmC with PRC-barrel domain